MIDMSPGEHDLDTLLRHMDPVLDEQRVRLRLGPEPAPGSHLCIFRETEGVTLILPRADAERCGIPFTYPCRRITLTIHSSLEAVGLFAAVTSRLAEAGNQRERGLRLLSRSPVRSHGRRPRAMKPSSTQNRKSKSTVNRRPRCPKKKP